MSMQKATTTRKSSNCVNAGQDYWEYYRSLDREIKETGKSKRSLSLR